MTKEPELTDQEKLDRVAERILKTPKHTEDRSAATKADLERPYRISFRNGKPFFEEVEYE